MSDGMDEWYRTRNLMMQLDPGVVVRPAQDRMFQGAMDAIDAGLVPFAQGPCGAGKSLIVVPMSAKVKPGGRVIHSSYTKSQQTQMTKDGAKLVGLGVFSACVEVKGRSEYICGRRLSIEQKKRRKRGEPDLFAGLPPIGDAVRRGTRDEYMHLDDRTWRLVSSSSDNGCGKECGDADAANRARAAAQTPGALVVVNHSILVLDYVLGGVLVGFNESDALVLDEAHQAAGAFRSALGARITPRRLTLLAGLMEEEGYGSPGNDGPLALSRFLDNRERTNEDYGYLEDPSEWTDSEDIGTVNEWVGRVLSKARVPSSLADVSNGKSRTLRVVERLRDDIAMVADSFDDDNKVAWIDMRNPAIEVQELDVSNVASGLLRTASAAVATSATVAGPPMEELGGGVLVEVESPFDLETQRIAVYSASKDDSLERKLADLVAVVGKARGGVLVLAATNRGRDGLSVADRCVRVLERAGHRVGQQGSTAQVPSLVAGLKDGTYNVVVGTAAMREGIDVKGSALSMVVLFGLPWPYLGDPVLNARILKVGESRRWQFLAPIMELNLEQAIGRLIRDADDMGAVVLLDAKPNNVRKFLSKMDPSPRRVLK